MGLTPQFNMKHILPKTRLANTIMYVNPSQEVHLRTKLSQLETDQRRVKANLEQQQRTFCAELRRRSEQWLHDDEQRLLLMHLPMGRHQQLNLGGDAEVLYNSPRYNITLTERQEIERMTGPKLPVAKIVKDSMQIYKVNDETLYRRMPAHLKIKPKQMAEYNSYRGREYLSSALPRRDHRFLELQRLLSNSAGSRDIGARQLRRERAFITTSSRASSRYPLVSAVDREDTRLHLYLGREGHRTVDNLLAKSSPLPPISSSDSRHSDDESI